MRHRNDRRDDRLVVGIDADVAHERAVDLDRVHRQLLEVRQRRVPGAEIVDRQAHAELAQAVEQRRLLLDVLHEVALGELELEHVRGNFRALHRLLDGAVEPLAVHHLPHREVHRDAQPGLHGGLPRPDLRARGLQDPLADRDDQPRVLGHVDELVGRKQPAARVLPADQRFDPDQLAARHVQARLVVQHQLVPAQRQAQVVLDRKPLLGAGVHVGREELVVVAPLLLGVVHRHVGVLHERAAIAPVVGEDADADRARGAERLALDHHRRAHGGDHLLGHLLRALVVVAQVLEDHRELVSAQPRHGV